MILESLRIPTLINNNNIFCIYSPTLISLCRSQ